MNLPIEYSSGSEGYRYTEEVTIDMPAMKLSRQEVSVLLVARSSIEQHQGSAYRGPIEKFLPANCFPPGPFGSEQYGNIHRYVSYLPNGVSTAAYETLEIPGKAWDSREIEVDYDGRESARGKRPVAQAFI